MNNMHNLGLCSLLLTSQPVFAEENKSEPIITEAEAPRKYEQFDQSSSPLYAVAAGLFVALYLYSGFAEGREKIYDREECERKIKDDLTRLLF